MDIIYDVKSEGEELPKKINTDEEAVNSEVTDSFSTAGNATPIDVNASDVVTPENFRMPEQAVQTLDLYIEKLEEYHAKIGEEKNDVISQKAKVLEAVLGTDMLKTD